MAHQLEISRHWLYPATLAQATEVQHELARQVITEDSFDAVWTVGGADVSNQRYDPENRIYAAMVSLDATGMKRTGQATEMLRSDLPYIPGFLAFREVPALIAAFERLSPKPDLILVDGHGISHPRKLGIASHLGVLLDCPTVGVAKSILVGKPAAELGPEPGSCVPLLWKNREIGMCLRSKKRANPLYISVGHRISLETAMHWVLHCLQGYRLPEPTRQAHEVANQYRRMCLAK